MKIFSRTSISSAAIFLFAVFLFPFNSFSADVTLRIKSEIITFDQPPIIENSRTLVPMRAIFEELDAEIDWNDTLKTVTAEKGSTQITVTIGSTTAYVNNVPVTLDVPAKIVGSRTLVPLRFVSESLNCNVQWIAESKTVIITDNNAVKPQSGHGIDINGDGNIIYEGYFENGKYNGSGILYLNSGIYVKGVFYDGTPNGYAEYFNCENAMFEWGHFINGIFFNNYALYERDFQAANLEYENSKTAAYENSLTICDDFIQYGLDTCYILFGYYPGMVTTGDVDQNAINQADAYMSKVYDAAEFTRLEYLETTLYDLERLYVRKIEALKKQWKIS